ncbi:hypothetical protein Tco_0622063 [Tanacetum coccineum]
MLHQRMFESGTYKSLPEHIAPYEALEASMARAQRDKFLAEMDKSRKQRHAPSSSSKQQSSPHAEQPVEDIPIPDSTNISDSEDTDSAYLPKIKQRPKWLKPILDDERPAPPKPAWRELFTCKDWGYADVYELVLPKGGKDRAYSSRFEGQAYEVVKAFYLDVVYLQFQMEECHKMLTDQIDWANPEGDQVRIDISRPLPLSGPPGHVTIQTQFFFNKDLDYLRYGSKGCEHALSISKMKAARYHEFRFELLVPEHMWIDDVYTYDISASYGISHWWFNRQKFYSDRHTADLSRKAVRTHMRILSVVEKDFKKLYPSDFEDLNLLLLQGWDATGYEYKHDYTIIESSRAVVFPVSNNERKIMRFNEIYKFSDGTLINILEALHYRVKEYKVNRFNLGMNTRFWTDKDVARSKEFIHAIERRLKTRRIFRNLECFVGGRV